MSEQFGEIYDQYIGKIYRFIILKVESQEVAEDLCSEVFLRVFGEFQKNSIENIQAFLYQVARYTIADYYRKRASMKVVSIEEAGELVEETSSLFEEVMMSVQIEEVRKALGHLRDEYQNLIIWRYLDELSIQEIAQIMGKTEGSVRVGIHRALGALKSQMPASPAGGPSPALNVPV
ncbi:MAG: sigma-70 family RNA polymerase sigma factor [Patescibacteria group bacterium]